MPLLIISIKKLLEKNFYNAFISEFDNFNKAINEKKPGSKGPNKKELLNY